MRKFVVWVRLTVAQILCPFSFLCHFKKFSGYCSNVLENFFHSILRKANTAGTWMPFFCKTDVGISVHCFSLGTPLSVLLFLIIALGNGATNRRSSRWWKANLQADDPITVKHMCSFTFKDFLLFSWMLPIFFFWGLNKYVSVVIIHIVLHHLEYIEIC